jgi:hypothetical protein
MARPYVNAASLIAATFPLIVQQEFKNLLKTGYADVTETGTVPGSANEYAILLDQRILANGTLTVVCDGDPLFAVPAGVAPDTDEFSYSRELPKIQFHSSREGQSCSVTYTPAGKPIAADDMMQIWAELVALKDYVYPGGTGGIGLDVRQLFIAGQPALSTILQTCTVEVPEAQTKRVTRFALFAANMIAVTPDEVTGIRVTLDETGATGTDWSLNAINQYLYLEVDPAELVLTAGVQRLYVFCTDNAANHQDITVELTIQ